MMTLSSILECSKIRPCILWTVSANACVLDRELISRNINIEVRCDLLDVILSAVRRVSWSWSTTLMITPMDPLHTLWLKNFFFLAIDFFFVIVSLFLYCDKNFVIFYNEWLSSQTIDRDSVYFSITWSPLICSPRKIVGTNRWW